MDPYVVAVEHFDSFQARWQFSQALTAAFGDASDWPGMLVNGEEPNDLLGGGQMTDDYVILQYPSDNDPGDPWLIDGTPPPTFAAGQLHDGDTGVIVP